MHEADPTEEIVYNITPPDRIVERARGCWSCTAYDLEGSLSTGKWTVDRERNLNLATTIAMERPDPVSAIHDMMTWATDPSKIQISLLDEAPTRRIKTILRMVDKMDHAVASSAFRLCLRSPAPSDRKNAEWFSATYLCSGWTGRQGSSVATEGAPLDKLPDELREEHQ